MQLKYWATTGEGEANTKHASFKFMMGETDRERDWELEGGESQREPWGGRIPGGRQEKSKRDSQRDRHRRREVWRQGENGAMKGWWVVGVWCGGMLWGGCGGVGLGSGGAAGWGGVGEREMIDQQGGRAKSYRQT
jgi:hypothetical protein